MMDYLRQLDSINERHAIMSFGGAVTVGTANDGQGMYVLLTVRHKPARVA